MSQLFTATKAVAAAATAEALIAAETQVIMAVIQAQPANTGTIKIRDAAAGVDGLTLTAGQTLRIDAPWVQDTFDLALIFLKASVNGEGVDFTYFR